MEKTLLVHNFRKGASHWIATLLRALERQSPIGGKAEASTRSIN
jgi:hypothetical protein